MGLFDGLKKTKTANPNTSDEISKDRMMLNQEVIAKLMEVELLSNIGSNDEGVSRVVGLPKIEKSINSLKWENICLEEVNSLTGFLAVNHSDAYNLHWNRLVDQIKDEVLPSISSRLDVLIETGKITESI